MANEHTEQVDLAQSSPGIMTAQGAGCGSVLHGGLLAVLFACHAFLKDIYPLVEQGIFRVVSFYESPSDREMCIRDRPYAVTYFIEQCCIVSNFYIKSQHISPTDNPASVV